MTMNTASKLKLCNRLLGLSLILMLVSGIQLEATAGCYAWSVWVHIALGIILIVLSLRHIYLHYRTGNWFSRFAKNRNTVTRILWWIFLLTSVSGILATIIWIADNTHSHLGGIHGKIGFLMVILAIIHLISHRHKAHKQNRLKNIDAQNEL